MFMQRLQTICLYYTLGYIWQSQFWIHYYDVFIQVSDLEPYEPSCFIFTILMWAGDKGLEVQ